MARPQKQTVDYFPHDTDASESKTLTIIQSKYGNDGYAFWFKLLQLLGKTPGHYFDFNKPADWEFLLAKTHIKDTETATEMLNTLSLLDAIDPELYQHGIIWCQKFVDRIADVYGRTVSGVPERPKIDNSIITDRNCIICGKNIENRRSDAKYCSDKCRKQGQRDTDNHVTDKRDTEIVIKGVNVDFGGVSVTNNGQSADRNPENATEMPQTKLKETKLNKNIYIVVFDLWNSLEITKHKKLTDDTKRAIGTASKDYSQEEICQAIKNYAEILKGDQYYFKYTWTLKDFLKRGMEKFLDLEIARQNYLEKKGGQDGTHRQSSRGLPTTYTPPAEARRQHQERQTGG